MYTIGKWCRKNVLNMIKAISLYCVGYIFGVPFIRGSTVFPRIMGSQRLTADQVSYMCLPIPVSPKNSGISRDYLRWKHPMYIPPPAQITILLPSTLYCIYTSPPPRCLSITV